MLLHVIKPPLPVHPDLDLAPRGQSCLCEMISLGPTAGHSQHRDVIDGTTVIRLWGEKSSTLGQVSPYQDAKTLSGKALREAGTECSRGRGDNVK